MCAKFNATFRDVEHGRLVRALVAAGLLAATALPATAQSGASVAEQYLFSAANAERARRGIQVLRWEPALSRAAVGHAEQMAARENISHEYAGEPGIAERAQAAGAKFSVIAENVAEASTAVRIHDAWMNSPGHRENLLDPRVDAVGISVVRRHGQLYAVQDFERSVQVLSLEQQETAVVRLVAGVGGLRVVASSAEARQTCGMESGFAGARRPGWVIRYTAGDVGSLPNALKVKIVSGGFRQAAIGACMPTEGQPFASYSLAVMLYR